MQHERFIVSFATRRMRLSQLSKLFLLLLLPFFTACKDQEGLEISPDEAAYLTNLSYGDQPNQIMDVYLQKDRTTSTPLIVLIHGGGWGSGDKDDYNLSSFIRGGLNVVNINYRLANGTTVCCPEMISDIHKALTYVMAHANLWHIRNKNFVLWGNSAGGHLSMLYAYKYDSQNLVSAIISFGGPAKIDDLESWDLNQAPWAFNSLTGMPWDNEESTSGIYQKYSPYYAVSFRPSFLVHGEKDATVPLRQAVIMQERLAARGTDHKLVVLTNAGHSGENASTEEMSAMIMDAYQWILDYSK